MNALKCMPEPVAKRNRISVRAVEQHPSYAQTNLREMKLNEVLQLKAYEMHAPPMNGLC